MRKILFILASGFLIFLLIATFGISWFFDEWAFQQNIDEILLSPSFAHPMGTDSLGRDVALRLLVGGRLSLAVALLTALLTLLLGFTYGFLSGWGSGLRDRVMMRINDLFMAIPSFVLVALLCLSLNMVLPFSAGLKAFTSLLISISVTHWMVIARVSRGLVMEMKAKPFIEAAIAVGASPSHILIRHIFPNMRNTLLILLALQIPATILYESFMSFVGLGIQPPYASWGTLVREGWKTLSSFPHLTLFPAGILFLTVWSIHIVTDKYRN
jgi:oligopeptide transport system permease protein